MEFSRSISRFNSKVAGNRKQNSFTKLGGTDSKGPKTAKEIQQARYASRSESRAMLDGGSNGINERL